MKTFLLAVFLFVFSNFGNAYYCPVKGRFLNLDPIGEEGGVNLYAFVWNDGVNGVDYVGLLDTRSEATISALYSKLQPLARSHLNSANEELKKECKCAKAIDGLRTVSQQNNIPSQNTRARGLTSYHLWGLAYDVGIFKLEDASGHKVSDCQQAVVYLSDDPGYDKIGSLGTGVGLEWGGAWTSIVDKPHYQYPLSKLGFSSISLLINHYNLYLSESNKNTLAPHKFVEILPWTPKSKSPQKTKK